MSQLPSILKESNNPDSLLHIGGILSGGEPLCRKIPVSELDLTAWVSTRGWKPNEKFCRECAELYEKGFGWRPPSVRK